MPWPRERPPARACVGIERSGTRPSLRRAPATRGKRAESPFGAPAAGRARAHDAGCGDGRRGPRPGRRDARRAASETAVMRRTVTNPPARSHAADIPRRTSGQSLDHGRQVCSPGPGGISWLYSMAAQGATRMEAGIWCNGSGLPHSLQGRSFDVAGCGQGLGHGWLGRSPRRLLYGHDLR